MNVRELWGKLRGEPWFDGQRLLLVRDLTVAASMPRPVQAGLATVEPCVACARPLEPCILTTGTAHGDPAVWDVAPIAVDGWACRTCDAVRYPRALTPAESTRFGEAGTAAVGARRWREAEFWFTRIAWAWPGYAAAHLDLATALGERLRAGFDTDAAARHRVRRRRQEAYDSALEAVEVHREHARDGLRWRVYLAAAEAAAEERSADRALRILERFAACEHPDEASAARAAEIRTYVELEKWVFADASAVLRDRLQLMGSTPRPIATVDERTACLRAVESLEAHHEAHPSHWQSIWLAAMGRAALGDTERTLARWRDAWRAHPDRPEIVREAALAFLRVDRVAEAVAIDRDATGRIPGDATLWCNRAVTELLSGDRNEALRCVHESQRLDPADPIARALHQRIAALPPEGPWPKTLAELEGRRGR